MKRLIVRTTLLITRVSSGAASSPAVAAFPGANGRIAFASNRDGDFEIYTMRHNGSNPTNRTTKESYDAEPAWSPNGRKITFVSDRDGTFDLYTMNRDGGNLKRLTDDDAVELGPDWQPKRRR